ncbi:MAG: pabC [Amycolatopsis sp.]|uniref:aminodeoxychorismate lyase n=1 Tax=Amycolatopsis sp. TaxID=37632 RepID=UPI00263888AD|nr:aminodeoxychorismate lyase [Amycolatopsis sp.]MCU1681558.1 pabC [Amycolatopsis sp.]
MRVLAFLDGTLADPDTTQIRVDDLGLLRGDGIFETILVVDGKARELGPHLERLAHSAAMLDLPVPDRAAWERVAQLVIDNWTGGREIALKLLLTRGVDGDPEAKPTGFALGLDIEEKVVTARAEGVAAVTLERGIDSGLAKRAPWLLLGAKTVSYAVNMAALREAKRRGADDVIFTAGEDSVFEGPTSTVVVVRDRVLYTVPTDTGVLPGTTQAALFRGAERAGWTIKFEPLRVSELFEADGVMLASSVRKVTRVHTLDGRKLPDSAAVHAELLTAYEGEYA